MAWSNLQPQAPGRQHRTRACPDQSPTPACIRPDQFPALNTAQRSNEAVSPHSRPGFPIAAPPSPTSAADRNPHSRRLCPAGSFLGDFRTPDGARNSSRTLNVGCLSFSRPEADSQQTAPAETLLPASWRGVNTGKVCPCHSTMESAAFSPCSQSSINHCFY